MAISRISHLAASHVMHTVGFARSESKSSVVASRAIHAAVMAGVAGYVLADKVKAEPASDFYAPIEDAAKRIFGSDIKSVGSQLKKLERALAKLIEEKDQVTKEEIELRMAPVVGASGSNPDRAFYEAMGTLKDRQERIQADTKKVQEQLVLLCCQLEAVATLKPCGKGI